MGRTATPVGDGEAADAVKLLNNGRILGPLHGRMTRVAVIEAVVNTQIGRMAADG